MDPGERRLVIAIDYGTTFTGVAISTPSGTRAILDEIDVIQDWGPGMANSVKIPSVISYSPPGDDQEQQWGASLSENSVAMVHTKLQLDICNASAELDLILQALDGMCNLGFQKFIGAGGARNYTWKGPEQIVEDYLIKVFDRLLDVMEPNVPEALRVRIPVDIVVTVPAEWEHSYRAKNSTFRAITRAGFNIDTFPCLGEVLLVSEPEAAAIYTARYLKESSGEDFLRKGECFVVCDAGGGTVDVVSYKVKELRPNFEIEAVTPPHGDKCGSIFINLEFKKWLRGLIGETHYQELDQALPTHDIGSHDTEGGKMRKLMKAFNVLKGRFKKDQRPMKIDLPKPLHNLNIEGKVDQGQITISNNTMRSFFDPSVKRLVELIDDQILQIEVLGRRPRNIFLVGGFAESAYLRESIEDSLDMRNLQLRRPDTFWTAVVRGAAILGIEKSANKPLPTMSPCAQSYGLSMGAWFSDIQHHVQDRVQDSLSKTPVAKDQLMWLIKKGDLILSNKPREAKAAFSIAFPETSVKKGIIPIYAYDEDDIPARLSNAFDELTVVHNLEYDLTDIPLVEFSRQQPGRRGPRSYVASLTLTMRLSREELQVELGWKDRMITIKTIPL